MMVFLIILAVILLLALLRFGVALRYNDDGFVVWVRIGFLSFKVYPAKKKKVKKKKKMDMKVLTDLKPESLNELKSLLTDVKSRISRIKRRILIKRFEVEYTAAGDDPSKTAITFGRANVLAGLMLTLLHDNFRVKRCNLNVLADFESEKQRICLDIVITIAVWEALYVFFTLLPLVFSSNRDFKTPNMNRKEIKQNG